jgi:hypothetical protein
MSRSHTFASRGAFHLRETIYPNDETLLRLAKLSHQLEGNFREEFDGYVYRLWLDLEDAGVVKPVLLVQSPDKDNFAFLHTRLIATLSELGGAFRN